MDVLIYVGKSAGILSIFYLVYYFVLRKDTFFTANRHFLFSGIFAAIMLPFLEFTKTTFVEAPIRMFTETAGQPFDAIPLVQDIAPSFTINWWMVLLSIYIIGCVILGVQLLMQLFSLLKLLRKYPSQQHGAFKFVTINEHISPFSFFRYIVFNPQLHSEKEIKMILAHEKVHAKQWHSIDILLANLIRIIQWVNPISWLYKKGLEENLEFIADDQTVQIIASKKEYQIALVKASSALYAPALTVQFYQSFIKKRIIMLNKSNSNKYNQLKLSLIIPFLALFLWSFNVNEVVEYTNSEITSETIHEATTFTDETPEVSLITSEIADDDISTYVDTENSNIAKAEKKIHKPVATANSVSIKNTNPTSEIKAEASILQKEVASVKDYRFTITSKTSDAELAKFKTELKRDHNLDMSYSVDRNNSGEITSMTFSYTGKGNNGSYSVNDDTPIDDFYFYIKENGDTGFWSGEHTKHHQERLLERSNDMEERHKDMEERHATREEHRLERHVELESRRGEMAERSEEMRERMEEEREELREVREEREVEIHELKAEMKEHQKNIKREHKNLAKQHRNISVVRSGNGNTRTYRTSHNSDHSIILDKDTTDATLQTMKKNLAAKGISFSFSKVKRNKHGELTRIKIDVNDGKGSKQSIFTKTDDGEPIDEMVIQL